MNAAFTPTRKAGKCLLCSQPEQSSNSHRKKWDSLEFGLEIIWGQDHENLLLLLCVTHGWVGSEELRGCSQSCEGSATGRKLGWGHPTGLPAWSQRKARSVLPRETARDATSPQREAVEGVEGTWSAAELCLLNSDRSSELQLLPAGLLILNCWLKLQLEDLGCLSFMGFSDFSVLSKT